VAELKQASSGNLVIMGSGELIAALMAADLIDEYLLMIHPLVLGTGRRLFPGGGRASLRLIDSVITTKGVLIATYEPDRDENHENPSDRPRATVIGPAAAPAAKRRARP
jgi:dihydrofolate reductase